MNYFELFGLPIQFELDGSLLSSQFRMLQKRFHPDNFANASERDRLLSVQQAAQINDAYQTLKDPLQRAEYLLSLQGIAMNAEQQTLQDPLFLMEQMELREELESLASLADPEAALLGFERKVSTMQRAYLTQLQDLLSHAEWPAAADQVRKLKFIAKLKHEVERVEDQLLG
ncbi:co-chaperone HscB [Vibrio sp. HDW18]|uniref:co-chaperone HscB n=1 Tax=Vibrio sp. HDW18 TaxID=2714948 RepID=UPI00140E0775|nr:co-chaperone HscB [Vibrio sp. HDW18]QIL86005.1 co-chaperone HscB [Vibrio sp. HDW18]